MLICNVENSKIMIPLHHPYPSKNTFLKISFFKHFFCFLLFQITISSLSYSQDRIVTRGAQSGELYLATYWYGIYNSLGPPHYDNLRCAVYHITENGKKLTIQYNVDYSAECSMLGSIYHAYIFADATPGVLYVSHVCSKNGNFFTQLWVSFDFGKNWALREEKSSPKYYYPHNAEGLIFRNGYDGAYKSENFGYDFYKMEIGHSGGEPGLMNEEVFSTNYDDYYNFKLLHTYNLFISYTETPIDSPYIFRQTYARFPDLYRGGKEGEIYVDSFFPWNFYKVSFSDDFGHTFRHVYITDSYVPQSLNIFSSNQLLFMSDREPGVFYILHLNQFADINPYGWHLKLCVDYYRDYGETLVDTYCHDVTKDYVNETCEAINDLSSGKPSENSVLLTWSEPEEDLEIEGYCIYRNNVKLTNNLITNTSYLDKNLLHGNYEYYVVAYYANGCVSYPSNRVEETIVLGMMEVEHVCEIVLFPNPTTGQLRITNFKLQIENVEIIDVYGRKMLAHKIESEKQIEIDISHLQTGIYIVKVLTEKGITIKKTIKY